MDVMTTLHICQPQSLITSLLIKLYCYENFWFLNSNSNIAEIISLVELLVVIIMYSQCKKRSVCSFQL